MSRQDIVRSLRRGESLTLRADPLNEHSRWAVEVWANVGQIGFLPEDARDASAILKGEPVSAKVHRVVGGTNWFNRSVLGKRHVGVVVAVTKGDVDWGRFNRLRDAAEPLDEAVRSARALEKSGNAEAAIAAYYDAAQAIQRLTQADRYASAHRRDPAPIDRLSLLLERAKQLEESLQVIRDWRTTCDPVQPNKTVAVTIKKREARIAAKLGRGA